MTDTVEAQASLEAILKDEIINMYQEVAENPEGEFHFYHGRQAAEMFGYRADWLGRAPADSVASFAGVGNPHAKPHAPKYEVEPLNQLMIRMIASLGGYVIRRSTQPGPQTLWFGLQRVHDLSTAWEAFGPD